MNYILKTRKNIAVMTAILIALLTIVYITSINGYDQAGAEVGILFSPNPSRGPDPVPPNATIKLVLTAGTDAPDDGQEIAVWDGDAAPFFLFSNCTGFEKTNAGGIKWQLRADSDAAGLNNRDDFLDGTSSKVGYRLPTPSVSSITFEFGNGGKVTITPAGGATVTPAAPAGGFAFISNATAPSTPFAVPTPGTDSTFIRGSAPDIYEFASCGTDRIRTYSTQVTFAVDLPNTTLTKTANKNTVNVGESVTYTYNETNAGNINLKNAVVTDDKCSPVTFNSGDDGDNVLEHNESWIFKCTTSYGSPGTVTNTAFVTATVCSDDVVGSPNVVDCNLNLGQHTGNPTCMSGNPYPICDPDERAQVTVRVVQQPTKIIIKKDTIPNDPQDFIFNHNIPPTPFSSFILDDDSNPLRSSMKTFDNPPSGTYTVTETIVKDIPLQSIRCVSDSDPNDTSTRSGTSAIIDLDAGEQITCTFTNGIVVPSCETGRLPEQPEDSISMTSIRSNSIVKTIHAEKQVFNCQLPQGSIPVIADVTIIAEIYQDINTKSILSKQVEVVTCVKDPATIKVLDCKLSIPSTDRIPVTNCQELEMQHPQEMNTVRKGATAKTIETQKEVFTCTMNTPSDTTDDKKVDLVLFTEIYQNLNTLTSQNPTMLAMKCVIKIDTVQVEACNFRQVNS